MGYTTTFDGVLKFKNELKTSALTRLSTILGKDLRDLPDLGMTHLTYMDYEVSKDYGGIEWDGSEKSYDMVKKVNFLIKYMREEYPDFALEGSLLSQGEEVGDVWYLKMNEEGTEAREVELTFTSPKIRCPHCEEVFHIEQAENIEE